MNLEGAAAYMAISGIVVCSIIILFCCCYWSTIIILERHYGMHHTVTNPVFHTNNRMHTPEIRPDSIIVQ